MEKLIELLEDLNPQVDYSTCNDLIDGHYLDSLAVLSLVADIEEEYDIVVPTVEIIPANFNSAQAIYNMIVRLQEEE